jgi:hypothetical protein
MTGKGSASGRWRIGVRGTITPSTALLLADLQMEVVRSTTLLETRPLRPDACGTTIARLQSLGLEVVDLHWVPIEPGRPISRSPGHGGGSGSSLEG